MKENGLGTNGHDSLKVCLHTDISLNKLFMGADENVFVELFLQKRSGNTC